ncbi:ACT domain-containing protein [Pleomorphochaeta sp. DL1XJH-081]|uniref:ACT domain-containing protein n=1 Tax=Pleomorphochaeta sp. DL1XJH-081 TaxID=3409690 RepID=UPI003BB7D9D3
MESKERTSSAKEDLHTILASLEPVLDAQSYVFSLLGESDDIAAMVQSIHVWATVREYEGVTCILAKEEADRKGWSYQGVWRRITCMVHSSLEAVGLTAMLSSTLARHGISANIVAAFYHDHVFVPDERADEAMQLLLDIQKGV